MSDQQKPFLLEHMTKQLTALGYKDGDEVCLRAFYPKNHPNQKDDNGRKAVFTNPQFPVKTIEGWVKEGRGVYLVVNPGGHTDDTVTCGRALFYEHDYLGEELLKKFQALMPDVVFPPKEHEPGDETKPPRWVFPKAAQKTFWTILGLPEPTMQVDTGGKSVHTYWTLSEAVELSLWRPAQEDMIAHSDADPVNKNPSRVMRLAGILNTSTGEYSRIIGGHGKPHDYSFLRKIIPVAKERSGISYTDFCRDFKFPIEDGVPLKECLSRANQRKLKEGSDDYRNQGAFNLACDLMAVADFLEGEKQRYTGDPYELFIEYCEKCPDGGGWGQSEWDQAWASAEKKPRGPAVQVDGVITRVRDWAWKNCPQKDVLNIAGSIKTFGERQTHVELDPIPEEASREEKLIIAISNYIKLRDSGNNFKFFPYRQELMDGDITGKRISLNDIEILAKELEREHGTGLLKTSDFLGETYHEIEERSKSEGLSGLKSGFYEIDDATQGYQRSDLICAAARPGLGKSTFILQTAKNISYLNNLPVAFYSLEMSKHQLAYKLFANETSINSTRLRAGKLNGDEWKRLGNAVATISGINLYIDDTPYITITEVIARSRKLHKQTGGLGAIIIDYLQLMIEGNDPNKEIGKITKQLKGLARELNIPIFILSQLNRGVENRSNKRPAMSDLRDSGNIEQDCDIIMMLYREDYYDPQTSDRGVAEIIITKHRNGPTGSIKLLFQPEFSRFENMNGGIQEIEEVEF